MENKNVILEEINRMKLLFSYDSSRTLTENVDVVSEQVSALKNLFKADAAVARTAAREIEAGMAGLKGGVTRMDGVLLKNADDIVKAVKAGKLAPAELGRVNTALFKNTTNPAVKKAVLQDIVGTGTFTTKYGAKTEAEAIAALEAKGWTKADAKAAVKEYKASGKTFKGGKTTTTTGGSTKNTKKPTKKRVSRNSTKINSTKGSGKGILDWRKVKEGFKNFTRTKIFKYLLIAGGLYLVYKWWMDEGSSPFPDCIGKNIPEEDFERMVNEGDGSVIISETGVSAIDRAGGGRFYDDKKFTTGNGKYSGTWREEPGAGVIITIEGNDYSMSCEGVIEDEEDTDGGDGGGDGYTPCSSFPYKKGCKSNDIKKVQECLGISADGKLGPGTEKAIKAKGYSVPLSQSDYDKIIANCGGSSSSSTTTTTTVYTGGEMGSIENFV